MAEMIKNATLLDVSIVVIFIVGLIKGVKYLKKTIREFFQNLLDDQFEAMNKKLDDMQDTMTSIDTQSCKNFLVRYLADIDRGAFIYESERQRFWEEYDHYIKDLGENSFIKEWVAKLKEEGKLSR